MLYSIINIINFAVSQMISSIVTIGIRNCFFPSLKTPWFSFHGLLEEVGLSWLRDGPQGMLFLGAESTVLSTVSNVPNFLKKPNLLCFHF